MTWLDINLMFQFRSMSSRNRFAVDDTCMVSSQRQERPVSHRPKQNTCVRIRKDLTASTAAVATPTELSGRLM